MKRDDWTGLGVSVGVHVLLLFLFALTAGSAEPPPEFGLVEVEFGPLQTAQPAAPSDTPKPAPTKPEAQPQPDKPAPKPTPPEPDPVKLPDRTPAPDESSLPPPKPQETIADPAPETPPERPVADPAPTERTGGTPTGTTGSTSQAGDTGESAQRRAPYSIEGLDRVARSAPLPQNPGAVGTVTVRVTVAPNGRVVAYPLVRRGGPDLDRAVQAAVRNWRFNPLPPAAPQENQSGTITFYFSLN